MNYILMHGDYGVAKFSLEGNAVRSVTIYDEDRLPVGYYRNIETWLRNRAIPSNRKGLFKDLGSLSNFEFMIQNYCVSLYDSYWIQPEDADLSWKDINLFTNKFYSSSEMNLSAQVGIVPDSTTGGMVRKKWFCIDDGNFLVKAGSPYQTINEKFVSMVYEKQRVKVPYVKYRSQRYRFHRGEEGTGSVCKCFCTQAYEFIPASCAVMEMRNRGEVGTSLKLFLDFCSGLQIDMKLYQMIMVDFLTSNLGNRMMKYGVLRRVDDLQLLGISPVFDFDNAMFFSLDPLPENLLGLETNSFVGSETKLLAELKDRSCLDLRYIPSSEDVFKMYSKIPKMTEERLYDIIGGYEAKIKYIDDYQNGASIWTYEYAGGEE